MTPCQYTTGHRHRERAPGEPAIVSAGELRAGVERLHEAVLRVREHQTRLESHRQKGRLWRPLTTSHRAAIIRDAATSPDCFGSTAGHSSVATIPARRHGDDRASRQASRRRCSSIRCSTASRRRCGAGCWQHPVRACVGIQGVHDFPRIVYTSLAPGGFCNSYSASGQEPTAKTLFVRFCLPFLPWY